MTRLRADFLLLSNAFLWGLAFYFQKDAMAHIGPLTFIAARSLIATLVLLPLAWRERTRFKAASPGRSIVPAAAAGGVAFFLAAWLQQVGLTEATVTNAGFLTALYVVVTPLIGWIVLRQQPNAAIWPAIVLSFAGTWALSGGAMGSIARGDLLVAASAVFWALHVVITGHASAHGRPFAFTCLQFAAVSLLAAIGTLATETPSLTALDDAAAPILYVGLVSTALTFTVLVFAMRATPAAEAAILLSTESLFAALAGAILLDERLSAVAWAGAGLIMLAVFLVQLAPRKSVAT